MTKSTQKPTTATQGVCHTEQTAPTPNNHLAVDFSHRLASYSPAEFTDSLGLMTDRALGVLHLLSCQFEDDGNRLTDDLICMSLDAVINEIQDIKSIVSAYNKNQVAKTRGVDHE